MIGFTTGIRNSRSIPRHTPGLVGLCRTGQLAQQHLVDGLDATSLFLYIIAYIIYITKEIRKGIEHRIGLRIVFNHLGIGDDADATLLDMHVNVATGGRRVAIKMDGSRLGTVNPDALGAEGLDF